MKKIRSLFICLICIFFVVGCSLGVNDQLKEDTDREEQTEDNTNKEETIEKDVISFDISYIENLMVDVAGAKGFGIKKDSRNEQSARSENKDSHSSYQTNPRMAQSIDAFNSKEESESGNSERYYLYTTTKEINNGDVEFEESSITKVSFKLNEETSEDVRDADGNIISESTVIEQDDIPAQINKLYVTDEFIYIQFVPLVSESGFYNYIDNEGNVQSEKVVLRPESLVYDENGVAEFDKSNYYSGALSKCFVISISTGYIYQISGVQIDGFINGLLSANKSYYRIFVEQSKLHIEDVLPNKDVAISNVIKDNYGWIFVANNKIDDVDKDNKIIYTTNPFVWQDKYNNIYETEYFPDSLMPYLKYEYINGERKNFEPSKLVKGLRTIFNNYARDSLIAEFFGLQIYNGNLYTPNGQQFSSNLYSATGGIGWFDDEFDYIIDVTQDGKIAYAFVDIFTDLETVQILTEADFTVISSKRLNIERDGYYQKIGDNQYLLKNIYSFIGINGTEYYQLVRKDNSLVFKAIETVEYTNYIYIFQPLNK